jgi:cytochrome c5
MQKAITILFSCAAGLYLASCAPKASKAIAELPVESKEQILAQYNAEQLESGKVLFTNNCDKCHKLKMPETRTPEQWNKVLKRMIPRAKLSDNDGKLVRAYLIAHAKDKQD